MCLINKILFGNDFKNSKLWKLITHLSKIIANFRTSRKMSGNIHIVLETDSVKFGIYTMQIENLFTRLKLKSNIIYTINCNDYSSTHSIHIYIVVGFPKVCVVSGFERNAIHFEKVVEIKMLFLVMFNCWERLSIDTASLPKLFST